MKKFLTGLLAVIMGVTMMATPVMAATTPTCDKDKFVETAILGQNYKVDGKTKHGKCDDGNGSSTLDILKLVVEIMTIGIGILGVLGITIVGIQYLTAGGSEEKTRKAKRRMFEIVIGLVAYALIYAVMQWLMG